MARFREYVPFVQTKQLIARVQTRAVEHQDLDGIWRQSVRGSTAPGRHRTALLDELKRHGLQDET